MISDELVYRIQSAFSHVPTTEQQRAMEVFATFMTDRDEHAVMLMRGSAGTGKTTLAAAIVQALHSLKQQMVLLAPTGRAAKVFSLYASHPAYTIHRRIYRQKSLEGGFSLNYNTAHDTLFIVDEASMISNTASDSSPKDSSLFTPKSSPASADSSTKDRSVALHSSLFTLHSSPKDSSLFTLHSSLLNDLIQFVYNGRNCRLMLIGDRAQLPPVGEEESPALMPEVLQGYGLTVHECDLNEVLRQSQESGILFNATRMRKTPSGSPCLGGEPNPSPKQGRLGGVSLPLVRFQGFSDIHLVPGDELIETLSTSYSRVGLDDTLVITRSNKRANIYNQGIRNQILGREEQICTGDQLMVVKNNYKTPPPKQGEPEGVSFIANGDRCVVRRVRNIHEQYGFHFAEATLTFPDYDHFELTTLILLDTLTSEAPALTREQQDLLYNKVMEDYQDIPLKADRMRKLKEDRYYNTLQVKFAYAATCHKAQGGQWAHVYIDQGYMTDDMLTTDYLHWLYTAFTRATEQLYLVNWPKTQTEQNKTDNY